MKQAAALLLAMPGTPFMYYGEEIGMTGTGAHENIRTPMQWDPTSQAGFTSGSSTWWPVNSNYQQYNVADQMNDPNSLLNYYRTLIHIRQSETALQRGYFLPIQSSENSVVGIARIHSDNEAVIALSNLSDQTPNPTFSLPSSSLIADQYLTIDLITSDTLGTVHVTSGGSINSWTLNGPMSARQNLYVKLSPLSQLSTEEVLPESPQSHLYPNPSTGEVVLTLPEKDEYSVSVWDLKGVCHKTFTTAQSEVIFNLEDLPSGLYFIRANGKSRQFHHKLFLQ
jgi:hypothetical protein